MTAPIPPLSAANLVLSAHWPQTHWRDTDPHCRECLRPFPCDAVDAANLLIDALDRVERLERDAMDASTSYDAMRRDVWNIAHDLAGPGLWPLRISKALRRLADLLQWHEELHP